MGATLTQKQIDQVFEGEDPGGTRRREPAPYSFRRPPSLTKSFRTQIGTRLEAFTQSLHLLLTLRLRRRCEATVLSVEQAAFSEFVLSLERPCSAFVFSLRNGDPEVGVLDLGADLSSRCVDRLLGGEMMDVCPGKLTRLEEALVRRLTEEMLAGLKDSCRGFVKLEPVLRSFESDPKMLNMLQIKDSILTVILEVRLGEACSLVTLGLPMGFLRERDGTLDRPDSPQGVGRAHLLESSPFATGIRRSMLDVSARLPATALKAAEISALEVGTVIDTSYRTGTPIEVLVNGNPTLHGSLGQVGGRLGIEITGLSGGTAEERGATKKRGAIL
ncbi:MAG: hypothetical protein GF346_07460 [Candidatus Eisenbacteria bacterium]|nr:hypothetical protein [Candidatus Latescibacterota bacterium]MBD3302269.1 hypothetical protein [Candidatus Eisenbacteria bacterium]